MIPNKMAIAEIPKHTRQPIANNTFHIQDFFTGAPHSRQVSALSGIFAPHFLQFTAAL